jgi:hypothetical protein
MRLIFRRVALEEGTRLTGPTRTTPLDDRPFSG